MGRRGFATAFVVVDGLDGAGKDTVAGILATLLAAEDRAVAIRSHPSSNVFGRFTRAALLSRGKLARLAATAAFGLDALVSTAFLRRLLRRHDAVIFVRYLLSAAYLPPALVVPVHDLFASFLPEADLKVYVETDPAVAMSRIQDRADTREMFENPASLARVRKRVALLLDDSWVVLDNNGTFRDTRLQVERLLPRVIGGRTAGRGRGRGRGRVP